MKITQRIASLVAGGVLVAGMTLAMAPAATAAPVAHVHAVASAAAAPSIHVTKATLVAKGAAVNVTLKITAPTGLVEDVFVSVTQAVKGTVTNAYVAGSVTGTGKAQTVQMLGTVQPGLKALKARAALFQGGMSAAPDGVYTFTALKALTMKITK